MVCGGQALRRPNTCVATVRKRGKKKKKKRKEKEMESRMKKNDGHAGD
jgi:hypothetical protein